MSKIRSFFQSRLRRGLFFVGAPVALVVIPSALAGDIVPILMILFILGTLSVFYGCFQLADYHALGESDW